MKIAILCKFPNKLTGTLQFLARRDFSAKTFTTLQDFRAAVGTGEYDFMAISLNFVHPNAEKIPLLMEQMFSLPVVVFLEDFKKNLMAALQSGIYKFKINGQLTGPALEMAVHKVLNEAEAKNSDKKSSGSRGTVRPGDDEDGQIVISSRGEKGNDGVYIDKGKRGAGHNVQPRRRSARRASELAAYGYVETSDIPFDPSGMGVTVKDLEDYARAAEQKKKTESQVAEIEFVNFWICVLHAVQGVCGENSEEIVAIEGRSEGTLLNLRTPRVRGTLVFRIGNCDVDSAALNKMMIDELFQQMQSRGLGHPAEQDYELVEANDQLIQDEILQRKRFRVARSGVVAEIEVSYVDHAIIKGSGEKDSQEFLEVSIASIQANDHLDFDVYLRFPFTNRFLLYVNEGRYVGEDQAVRLTGYGIRAFYVEKSQFDRYERHVKKNEQNTESERRGLKLLKKVS